MDSSNGSVAEAMRFAQAETMDNPHGYQEDEAAVYADVAQAEELAAPKTFTMEELVHAVRKQPLHKHIYRKVLVKLQNEATTEEMEAFISELPDFKYAVQPEGRFLEVLERAGGIERIGVDPQAEAEEESDVSASSEAEAEPVAEAEDGEATDEQEPVDTLRGVVWMTTDLGTSYIADTEPAEKLNVLFEKEHSRKAGYLVVMNACMSGPKKLNELVSELEGRKEEMVDAENVHPSVYLDRLEAAGIIVWDGAWALTEEGKSCLTSYLAESSNESAPREESK